LPMDITTSDTTERMILGPDTISVISAQWPKADKKGWYLKEEKE